MKKYERVKALVSLDAIAHNFEEMHRNVKEGTRIIAVIKADGYGHGARAIAKLIHDYDYIWGSDTSSFTSSVWIRSALTCSRFPAILASAAFVFSSTVKPSCAEKRTARSIRRASSVKRSTGFPTQRMIF